LAKDPSQGVCSESLRSTELTAEGFGIANPFNIMLRKSEESFLAAKIRCRSNRITTGLDSTSNAACDRCKRLDLLENNGTSRFAVSMGSMSPDKQALLAEDRKLRRLSRAMDIASILLWEVDLTLEEAQEIVNHAKHTALQLFPDKEATFDLIYGPRFRRILAEKYHLQ
jgi:hypothetical protein